MSSLSNSIYIGAAGTKSLIQLIEADIDDIPVPRRIIVSRHAFSVSTINKNAALSHNQRIESECNQEIEYYKLIDSLRSQGFTVQTFTQGSSYGNVLVSRDTGIKCRPDSSELLPNVYSKSPTQKNLDANSELVKALGKCNINRNFLTEALWGTNTYGEYHGSFLHDVKAYFAACCLDELVTMGIIKSVTLYIDENAITDYERPATHRVDEYVVDPTRVHDYSVQFNKWICNNTAHFPVRGVATDPGPGYKSAESTASFAQDCDDAIMLALIPHINRVHISDETCGFTRTLFTLSHFNDKIGEILTTHNDSVARGLLYLKEIPNCIQERDSEGCKELLLRVCRAPTIDIESLPRTEQDTLADLDSESVHRISFCPDLRTCRLICARALVAAEDRNAKKKSSMLSKVFMVPHKYGLIPASFNPNHTVLAGKGAGRSVPETEWDAGTGGRISWKENNGFTMIPDRVMTFTGSNGPNIVLAECNHSRTANRLNPFGLDVSDTHALLCNLISFREKHIQAMFSEWVDHLSQPHFLHEHKVDPTKDSVLDPKLHQAYDNTVSLFRIIRDSVSFQESGLGCVCLCQTWARNGSQPETALFSVMSPHFQVRFLIRDSSRVMAIPGVTPAMIEGYRAMVIHHDSCLEPEYSFKSGGQTFVNVDELFQYLSAHEQELNKYS